MKNRAIYSLYPNAVSIGGDAEIVLDANDIDITSTIDMDAVETKAAELLTAQNLIDLRKERNAKLAETDWVVTMHKEKGTNIPTALKTYRQALRDITDTYTSLDDVVWPEKP
jgi:hypothetical protein